jgi:RimJ/RimL family protein N-acetyltransferase
MQTQTTIIITGKNVVLKTLNECNATQEYCSWLNDSEVNRYLTTQNSTIEELRIYIREKNNKPDALLLGIFWRENGKHIGNIKLEPIEHKAKKAEMGILIGDKNYWGKGVATEATRLLTEWAFASLGLHKIYLGVNSANKAAIRVYQKVGFSIDEIKKNALEHENIKYDEVRMSITKR